MKKIPAYTISSPPSRALVYRIVFEHAIMRVFVLVLLCSFSLQTVERAFASEDVPPPDSTELITITDETVAVLTDEVADRSSGGAVTPTEIAATSDQSSLDETPIVESDSDRSTDPSFDPVSEELFLDVEILDEVTDMDIPSDDLPVLDELGSSTATTTDGTVVASTTDESTPTLTVESDQMIQFEKTNCLAVEDGSFYCQQATSTATQVERGLFALPDADGDLEIYVKNGVDMQQITFNTVDDASPYYDPASDSMVWHRIIDERYQIVVYDVASGEETQLTDTSTNNMEPFRADNIIVWQHWAHDAWQIMLYDGDSIKQLTTTGEHNLAPVVRNNLVVWHRVMYGEKTIEVYDLSSGAYMTIRDDEGGTITNPRMVLVYDASMDNGDTITRGYDLVTGEITSFAAEPTPIPDEIPEPDATGETRALLTIKSSSEEESLDDLGLSDTNTTSSPDIVVPTIATTSNLTLDLSLAVPAEIENTPLSQSDIPDLIIPALTPTPTTSPTVIPVVE